MNNNDLPSAKSKEDASTHLVIYILLAVIIVFSLAMRLLTAFIPLDFLIGVCLADDAFYYLQIAENIAQGNGVTFDGVNSTNGFHPVYMFVAVILKLLFPGPGTYKAAMVFFALVGTLNAFLLFLLAKRIGGATAGVVAAAIWALHPYVGFIEMMGVEAPLAVTALLLASIWWLDMKNGRDLHWKNWSTLGLLVGFAFLCRTDTIFFALLLALEILLVYRKELKEKAGYILLSGTVTLAVVSPWLIWNLVKFGRISQDSGRTIYMIVKKLSGQGQTDFAITLYREFYVAINDYFFRFASLVGQEKNMVAVGIGVVLGIVALVVFKDKRIGVWRAIPALIGAGFISWGFYNFVFMTRKYWYFLVFLAVATLLTARLISLFADRAGRARWVVVFLFFLLVSPDWFKYSQSIQWMGLHNWQRVYLGIARAVNEDEIEGIEKGDVLGAWNAGIYGAFSGHRVINLDGVVNANIYDAIEEKRFFQYLLDSGIDHVIDHEQMFPTYQNFSTLKMSDYLRLRRKVKVDTPVGDILILSVQKESEKIQPEPLESKGDKKTGNAGQGAVK